MTSLTYKLKLRRAQCDHQHKHLLTLCVSPPLLDCSGFYTWILKGSPEKNKVFLIFPRQVLTDAPEGQKFGGSACRNVTNQNQLSVSLALHSYNRVSKGWNFPLKVHSELRCETRFCQECKTIWHDAKSALLRRDTAARL